MYRGYTSICLGPIRRIRLDLKGRCVHGGLAESQWRVEQEAIEAMRDSVRVTPTAVDKLMRMGSTQDEYYAMRHSLLTSAMTALDLLIKCKSKY